LIDWYYCASNGCIANTTPSTPAPKIQPAGLCDLSIVFITVQTVLISSTILDLVVIQPNKF